MKSKKLRMVILYSVVGLVVFFSLAPFLWQVVTSFKPSQEIFSRPVKYIPSYLDLSAYVKIFIRHPFWETNCKQYFHCLCEHFYLSCVGFFGLLCYSTVQDFWGTKFPPFHSPFVTLSSCGLNRPSLRNGEYLGSYE